MNKNTKLWLPTFQISLHRDFHPSLQLHPQRLPSSTMATTLRFTYTIILLSPSNHHSTHRSSSDTQLTASYRIPPLSRNPKASLNKQNNRIIQHRYLPSHHPCRQHKSALKRNLRLPRTYPCLSPKHCVSWYPSTSAVSSALVSCRMRTRNAKPQRLKHTP